MLLRILDRLEEILIASLMAAATISDFHFRRASLRHRRAVLYPYLIRIHISWAQELWIHMSIWMAKFGAAYGVRTGIHVGVDVLINRLNPRLAGHRGHRGGAGPDQDQRGGVHVHRRGRLAGGARGRTAGAADRRLAGGRLVRGPALGFDATHA